MTVVRSQFPQRHHSFVYLFECIVSVVKQCSKHFNVFQVLTSSKTQQILQCVSMNVTLIYALLAYFS
ncbi:hypothetical protein GBAR_LOCUS15900, partial [Geodia barretti]